MVKMTVKIEWNPFYWHLKGKTDIVKRLAISPSITVKRKKQMTIF